MRRNQSDSNVPADSPRSMLRRFRRPFWLPPRAHGDVIEDRTVSFLELFYDLVYVEVIAQAAHTLAEHVTWRRVGEFVIVFGMIWIAWLNGTLYCDLRGREDGRTRVFVFIPMLLLALLAVFTGDAAGEGGTEFAATYAAYLAVLTWLWYTVRRQDSEDHMTLTGRYLVGNLASIAVIAASAALAAAGALLIGWWRPAPWLIALSLVALLSALWWFAVDRWLRLDDPHNALPGGG